MVHYSTDGIKLHMHRGHILLILYSITNPPPNYSFINQSASLMCRSTWCIVDFGKCASQLLCELLSPNSSLNDKPQVCTHMSIIGQGSEFPDDVALCCGKSWAGFKHCASAGVILKKTRWLILFFYCVIVMVLKPCPVIAIIVKKINK